MHCRNHPDVLEGTRACSRCGLVFCADCLVDIGGLPHCATCKTEQLLDVRSGVDRTGPLGYASILRRFAAIFVDGLILYLPLYILLMFVILGSGVMEGRTEPPWWMNLITIPFMIINFVYESLMLRRDGQTLGKKALRVRVVRPDGSQISTGQAFGRAALRTILGFGYIIDYIPVFFTKEKTTLHDMIARTRVIEVP